MVKMMKHQTTLILTNCSENGHTNADNVT